MYGPLSLLRLSRVSERCFFTQEQGEREQGRLVDALAPGGDEGRDKLR